MNTYLLHIETATKVCSVALSNNGQLIAFKDTDESDYVHGEVLTLFIESVLKDAGINPKDLAAVSVTSGPGSYTGLRIGVSTAKGLCYALGIPLISVNALLNLALIAKEKYPSQSICSMIDARRMEVFSCIYDGQLAELKSISADVIDADSYFDFEPFIAIGEGAAKMESLWQDRGINFDSSIKSSAVGHVAVAFEKFTKKEFEDLAYFEPFYLKDFVSTQKKSL